MGSSRALLQSQLDEHFGGHRAIVDVATRPGTYASSFRIDELDVRFEDGASVLLVLKDLSRDQMAEPAQRARPEFLYQPQREIETYRWLLPNGPDGTPRLYGSVCDLESGCYQLLLEQVRGVPLWQVGDVATWQEAAIWIARFHRSLRGSAIERLADRVGAIVCDEDWYWRWLHRARRFAGTDAAAQQVLTGVEQVFPRVVARLMSLPQTLIHGECYPSNILIRDGGPGRVCPVDWEMTAMGPALVDLAALTAGWPEAGQRAIARAYVSALDGDEPLLARSVRLPVGFAVDFDCCRLYLAVRMLGWSDHWAPPRDHAHDWLAEAACLARRLERLT